MNGPMKQIGALAGILFPILQMTAQGLIQVGGVEPSFSAGAGEILAFFQSRDTALFRTGDFLSVLSMLVFLWFLAAVWDSLREAGGEAGWLAMIVMGSGVVSAGALADSSGWTLAMFRLSEGLDPETARMLFDEGNLNFANLWVSLGSMVLATGLSFKTSGSEPGWLSWSTIVMGAALILARIVWTSSIAFVPYVLFWVWMIVIGVRLYRRTLHQTQ